MWSDPVSTSAASGPIMYWSWFYNFNNFIYSFLSISGGGRIDPQHYQVVQKTHILQFTLHCPEEWALGSCVPLEASPHSQEIKPKIQVS